MNIMDVRQYTVNFDSYDEVNKLVAKLLSRQHELRRENDPSVVSKNQRKRNVFNAVCEIYNYDISQIYSDIVLDEEEKYYVYAHCNPSWKIALKKEGKSTFAATLGVSNMPFYIGKGTGNRAYELNRNEAHRKVRNKIKTINPENEIDVVIIRDNLTEKEALMCESKLIDIFGVQSVSGGLLVNLDEGVKNYERRTLYAKYLHELNDWYKQYIPI